MLYGNIRRQRNAGGIIEHNIVERRRSGDRLRQRSVKRHQVSAMRETGGIRPVAGNINYVSQYYSGSIVKSNIAKSKITPYGLLGGTVKNHRSQIAKRQRINYRNRRASYSAELQYAENIIGKCQCTDFIGVYPAT